MMIRSQAYLEEELALRWERVQKGKMDLTGAFGIFEDCLLQLGERQVFLHPNQKRWFWYQRWNNEWEAAGCGPGEGILLTFGKTAGMKKLPQPGLVDDWCIYQAEGKLYGPLLINELNVKIGSHHIPSDSLIWSTRTTQWLKIGDSNGQALSLLNHTGEMILQVNPDGHFIKSSE